MKFVVVALLIVCALAGAAAVWRFMRVRNAGARGLFRQLPASGLHGWRHGVLRYKGEELEFFKLRSLSFSRDLALARRDISITGLRELTEQEADFMPGVSVVLQLDCPAGAYEFAADRRTEMALVSWVEAAPDRRQERRDLTFQAHQAHLAHQAQRGRGKA